MTLARIILHIPHASTVIPPGIRSTFLLDDESVQREILRMTDWFTDDLFDPPIPCERLIHGVSRIVCDPERFLDDKNEPMAAFGMGAVYAKTSRGEHLRSLTPAQREEVLRSHYIPHHERLAALVDDELARNGHALIIDCHSFPDTPFPYEQNPSSDRPDICLGADACHTPKHLLNEAIRLFQKHGYRTTINTPFSGSIVPLQCYQTNAAVQSLMIECNRALYMDERTGEKLPGNFERLKQDVDVVLTTLAKATHAQPGDSA